jgi:hypothetical protein
MRENSHVRFGGRPHGKGPVPRAPRRAAHPTEFGKDSFGLDQSQVRLYHAIARHTVLVMAALAVCAVTAALLKQRTARQASPPVRPGQPPPADPGMIPLTVPEVRRLIAAATHPPLPSGQVIHWSGWTRRHQARANWYHQRTRIERDQDNTMNPLVS